MKIKNHSRLRLWFLLIFSIYQLIAIDFYGLLLMLLIIDFGWMLLSGSTMYKHCNVLTVEALVFPVMIDCSSRSAMTRSFSLFPSLSNTVSDSSLFTLCRQTWLHTCWQSVLLTEELPWPEIQHHKKVQKTKLTKLKKALIKIKKRTKRR